MIVGLFHTLERFLREYFEQGIRWQPFRFDPPVSRWTFKDLRRALEEIGVKIEDCRFGKAIIMLRLLANTLKHGDGRSREDLRRAAPELFDRHLEAVTWSNVLVTSDDGLMLTPEEFDTLTDAVQAMWAALPVGVVSMQDPPAA